MTLSEFLLARIAEDEAGPRRWLEARRTHTNALMMARVGVPLNYGTGGADTEWVVEPRRVLAECDAKRRIVRTFLAVKAAPITEHTSARIDTLHDVIRALALPYAEHPDYKPEWRI